jgi:uncharacterized membrane protein YgcG
MSERRTKNVRAVLQGISQLEASRVDDYGMKHAAGTLAFEAQYFNLMDDSGDTTLPPRSLKPGSTLRSQSRHRALCSISFDVVTFCQLAAIKVCCKQVSSTDPAVRAFLLLVPQTDASQHAGDPHTSHQHWVLDKRTLVSPDAAIFAGLQLQQCGMGPSRHFRQTPAQHRRIVALLEDIGPGSDGGDADSDGDSEDGGKNGVESSQGGGGGGGVSDGGADSHRSKCDSRDDSDGTSPDDSDGSGTDTQDGTYDSAMDMQDESADSGSDMVAQR